MAAIVVNSLITGYLWLKGSNYCTNPTFIFVAGTAGTGLWCGACMLCFILVINRLLDIWSKKAMHMIFKGSKTYVVLIIPVLYWLYFSFFTAPVLFNSDQTAWFFYTFAPGHSQEDVS
ncbi:hypothetical protein NECAME_11001 [Necator americanus]|uniref:7TM GPCR serpentine receptor class x (Srx) domain-containing protein n=1 Tax=Necator americanus TaxID=51031 RepID=W2T8D8_NECAM|nr:hypothetical protein NECAME_11001 [Necator americanus]ETN77456.1 hypothetical protein NECAME_11001 [Necator americanus]